MELATEHKKQHYRSRNEIIMHILESIGERGANQHKIMYGAMLSFIQMKTYLADLTTKGIISYNEYRQVWIVTTRGERWMQVNRVLRDELGY